MSLRCAAAVASLLLVTTAIRAENPPVPLPPTPSAEQLAWQRMERTMFLHFGGNTFSDREWGTGKEEERLFQPTALDCRQWARTAKTAGWLELDFAAPRQFNVINVQEAIALGERSAAFPPVTGRWVRLHILDATFAPTLWEFGVYKD